ncbi:TetR/AcrR family transcriptional regulator [Acinetobacter baumannii]|uniref:TetR/AcrR family transcriptional regulator n=1 Tax=Acinetobacter baumannii TaxID=470 RepID=UPI000452396A|nr:TetR/AcrR family transcriptional regulator [Acinetobacter baumannii]EHU2105683.1 TetR/AcrR family transcriptional regulator [Acinetobacter baumannii]EXH91336.1 bacterial regulatory s, tetR family protein [Acinetobacter baumannii 318814]MDC4819033.1 TetR/AcrR family transcriptional regulator [Acinetobacter baumannii]MDC5438981.1 TetR/AcrR family transcriptional regulator [Acinetobacter baumannii]MDC5561226.1 TetR/AcrR family transcriptional regulator [Acinetobacter baumannii]
MAGRPREFDREEALVKARDFFWLHGYEGTSMSDLVEVLGIASARIYKAFGSKEALFREAVNHYENNEGNFALNALKQKNIKDAINQLFQDALALYTQANHSYGCMVVSAASVLGEENQAVLEWMKAQRIARGQSLVDRFVQAKSDGQLVADADPKTLGQYYALVLHGLSVQARDGYSKEELATVISFALQNLDRYLAT